MKTVSLDKERTGVFVVAAAGGFVCGYLCSRYFSSKGSVPLINHTTDEQQEDDTVSLADTPRSMDSSTSLAFQPKHSRFSHPDGSTADIGLANGDSSSGSSVDTKMALLVRVDLSMVRLMMRLVEPQKLSGAPMSQTYRKPHTESRFHHAVCGGACQALLHCKHWTVQKALQGQGPRVEAMGKHSPLLGCPFTKYAMTPHASSFQAVLLQL